MPMFYLSLAEALSQKTGASGADLAKAVSLINVVRQRAGLDKLSASNLNTPEKVLDALLTERWHESGARMDSSVPTSLDIISWCNG